LEAREMKKLLVVTLLFIMAVLFASCNSYDVEGKPEVAANPAKKVFAYYPWGSGNDKPDPGEDPDEDPATDDDPEEDPDEDEIIIDDDEEIVDDDEEITDDTEEVNDDEEITDDATIIPFSDGNTPPESGNLVSSNDQQEFEIINRGVTGELKIRKINFLDPNFRLISEENGHPDAYRDLFKIQVSKTADGIVQSGFNEKTLSFDNTEAEEGAYIAPLCPLDVNNPTRCKSSFGMNDFNTRLKILLSYDKAAVEKLMQNPPQETEFNNQTGQDELKYKVSGDFWIEVCTNDPTKDKSPTCGDNATSYLIQVTRQPNPPPKPLIKVSFDYTIGGPASYRNIRDKVTLNLKNTCVENPDKPGECLPNWEDRYYIKYKWEMRESPTPFQADSQIKLPDTSGEPGQWLADIPGSPNPKRAEFTGLMVTPRRLSESNMPDDGGTYDAAKCTECGDEPTDFENDFFANKLSEYLLCRQRYCERTKTKLYKINVQAETVDKQTDLVSETAELIVVPKIIPQARVVAQLTWLQGYKTKSEMDANVPGTKADLDIHLIKKNSVEAIPRGFSNPDGLMCTKHQTEGMNIDCSVTENEVFCRHDDCSFADQSAETSEFALQESIAWNASLDRDNTWGGGNYEVPETIGLGPIEENGHKPITDDEYLIVVGYSFCDSFHEDKNDCCPSGSVDDRGRTCTGEAYEVNARVDILVDGFDAPRASRVENGNEVRPADNYSEASRDFVIKREEWIVIATVKWDNTLPPPETNPSYTGDAIVTDVAMTDHGIDTDPESYKTCRFNVTFCELVPVWDPDAYYSWVAQPQIEGDDTGPKKGECY
jgi:hypothetical protein